MLSRDLGEFRGGQKNDTNADMELGMFSCSKCRDRDGVLLVTIVHFAHEVTSIAGD